MADGTTAIGPGQSDGTHHDDATHFPEERQPGAGEPRLHAGVHRARGRGGPDAQEDPRRDLPARRRGRAEHDRAVRRQDVLRRRPSIAIPKPARARERQGAIDLDGFFGLHPRMAPLEPHFKRGELAIIHASGSHDETRSHFDAQDYMESGTPGVKSTRDGWLNRYLHAKDHAERSTPFRAVALAQALPRSLQGTAPALAIGQLGQFGIRAGNDGGMMAAGFEAQYAKAADSLLGADRQGSVRRRQDDQGREPAGLHAVERRRVPAPGYGEALRQIAQVIKADLGLEVAFAEIGGWDHHANEGASNGQLANRLDDFAAGHRRVRAGPRRSHGGRRRRDDVGVRAHGGGERQPRHGPRPRQRDADPRRQRQGRQGLRQVARPRARTSSTRAATSRSRPTSATSSPRCVTGHLGARDISKIFPGYAYKQKLGFIGIRRRSQVTGLQPRRPDVSPARHPDLQLR